MHVSERDIVRVLIQMRCFVRKCCLFVFLSRVFFFSAAATKNSSLQHSARRCANTHTKHHPKKARTAVARNNNVHLPVGRSRGEARGPERRSQTFRRRNVSSATSKSPERNHLRRRRERHRERTKPEQFVLKKHQRGGGRIAIQRVGDDVGSPQGN